jgi:hypothetical protein
VEKIRIDEVLDLGKWPFDPAQGMGEILGVSFQVLDNRRKIWETKKKNDLCKNI